MTWFPSTPPVSAQEIAGAARLVLHCWAAWNAIDRVFDEQLQPLCKKFLADATFRSCDIDDPLFFSTLREWRILNVPALILIEHGRVIDVSHGLRPNNGLESILTRWLTERPHH